VCASRSGGDGDGNAAGVVVHWFGNLSRTFSTNVSCVCFERESSLHVLPMFVLRTLRVVKFVPGLVITAVPVANVRNATSRLFTAFETRRRGSYFSRPVGPRARLSMSFRSGRTAVNY